MPGRQEANMGTQSVKRAGGGIRKAWCCQHYNPLLLKEKLILKSKMRKVSYPEIYFQTLTYV